MVKELYAILILLIVSFHSKAQSSDFIQPLNNKIYAGMSVYSTYFDVEYKHLKSHGTNFSLIPIPYIHLGYKLSNRASAQFGVAYGNRKEHGYVTYYGYNSEIIDYHDYSQTKGIVVPVTMRFIVFNVRKRLPIYVTASLIPTYIKTKVWGTEVQENRITPTYSDQEGVFTVYATAGVGVSYKIKKRFSGFTEIVLLKSNLAGGDEYPIPVYKSFYTYKSFGTGVNYSF
jgi:hypothetical protein